MNDLSNYTGNEQKHSTENSNNNNNYYNENQYLKAKNGMGHKPTAVTPSIMITGHNETNEDGNGVGEKSTHNTINAQDTVTEGSMNRISKMGSYDAKHALPDKHNNEVYHLNASTHKRVQRSTSTAYNAVLAKWHRVSTDGELIYSGSRNLYRFPAQAFWSMGNIMIAVIADGTIIRWNSVAQQVTGFAPYEVIGQSIFDLLPSEASQQQLRELLLGAKKYAGLWEDYRTNELDQQHVFSFRQNMGLYEVGLALSVIPSNFAASA